VRYPAPVSLNTTSGGFAARYLANHVLVQMVARSDKWRIEVMAQSMGNRMARHAGTNQYGRYYVSTLVGLSGGGARSYGDGIDSSGMDTGGPSSSHNIEWVEVNFPVLYLYRRHVRDSAGAGQFRGGAAEESALVLHDAPDKKITIVALGTAGLRNGGQGLFGGYPGAPSLLVHHTETPIRTLLREQKLPETLHGSHGYLPYCSVELGQDDVLVTRFGGGGGYGDPLLRNPDSVLTDIRRGLVSTETAALLYGVLLDGAGELDQYATERKRAHLRRERVPELRERQAPQPTQRANSREPLEEYLQVCRENGVAMIECTRCSHVLCSEHEDWTQAATRRRLPPAAAGPLMHDLEGLYLLEQFYCPGCGVLLRNEIVSHREVRQKLGLLTKELP
jgi:N-methylhydantoinase B